MNHYTFIHTADLHLGEAGKNVALPREIRDQLRQENWEAFSRILQDCREKKIDFLFLAGDVFDHDKIRMTDLKALASMLGSLEHTRIYIAPGNHDPLGGRLSYGAVDWPENVVIFSEEAMVETKVDDWLSLWGFGWKNNRLDRGQITLEADVNPLRTNVLLLHGDLETQDSPYFPLKDQLGVLDLFDYVALGHVHKPGEKCGKLVYSGSPTASSFKDQGIRGYVKGHIQRGAVFHDFVPLDHIRFQEKNVSVEPDDTWEDIRKKLLSAKSGEKSISRIYLSGILDPDLDLNHILETLEGEFYHLELVDETLPDYDLERLYRENQGNVIGMFLRNMMREDLEDPVQRMALFYGLEALLQERCV